MKCRLIHSRQQGILDKLQLLGPRLACQGICGTSCRCERGPALMRSCSRQWCSCMGSYHVATARLFTANSCPQAGLQCLLSLQEKHLVNSGNHNLASCKNSVQVKFPGSSPGNHTLVACNASWGLSYRKCCSSGVPMQFLCVFL